LPIIYCLNQFNGKRFLRHTITLDSRRRIHRISWAKHGRDSN
jgi:hypothetical protein